MALALVRNLALVPVFLHFIDPGEYGAWLATGGVLAYMLMLDFGLMGVVAQRIAEAYGARDLPLLGRRIGTSLIIAAGLSLATSLISALAAPLVPRLMAMSGPAAERLMYSFLIVALANGVNLLALASRAVLRSLQRPILPGLSELAGDLGGIALTLVLLFDGRGLYALALGLALRSLLTLSVNSLGCLWVTTRELDLRLRWSGEEARAIWGKSAYQFFASIATRLQSRSDAFFVGLILGKETALIYALTTRAHETVRLVSTHFVASVQPSLAHLHGDRDVPRFRGIVLMMLGVAVTLSGVGMAGVVAFNGAFVELWVGGELYGGLLLTALIALAGLVADLGSPQYGTLIALGEFRRLCRAVWEATLVRLPLLVLLLWLVGLWGAAVAAVVAAVVQTVRLSAMTAEVLPFSSDQFTEIGKVAMRAVLPAAALAAVVLLSGATPTSWISLLLAAATFASCAAALAAAANPALVRQLAGELGALRAASRRG